MSTRTASQSTHMVLGQLFTNRVADERILNAMAAVPRERFVPPMLAGAAYADEDLPIGAGRFLIAPLPFARLAQMAGITPEEKVLVVGCGTGYSLAVLAALAGEVYGCDIDSAFVAAANTNLAALGIKNARAEQTASLPDGFAAGAPYDAILIEGAAELVPEGLKGQLAPRGRLVVAERAAPGGTLVQGLCRLVTYIPAGRGFSRKASLDAALPLLPGFAQKKGFLF